MQMVIVFHHQSYQQPHQTPDCSVFWNINIFRSFLFLLFIKYFFLSKTAKYRTVRCESVTDVIVIIWAAAAMWIAVKKSYWQYLIECHSRDAVTKSHTTKIVAGSYCTKMSVICVKSSSFVWHERIIIILYRMCIWYLRGWTRQE